MGTTEINMDEVFEKIYLLTGRSGVNFLIEDIITRVGSFFSTNYPTPINNFYGGVFFFQFKQEKYSKESGLLTENKSVFPGGCFYRQARSFELDGVFTIIDVEILAAGKITERPERVLGRFQSPVHPMKDSSLVEVLFKLMKGEMINLSYIRVGYPDTVDI